MRRRDFITLLGGAAATWPLAAHAQQPAERVYRVGYLSLSSRVPSVRFAEAFEDGLRRLGYRVGENITIEYRYANGQMERLPALAAELVRLGVDIIIAGSNPSAGGTKTATPNIPIVLGSTVGPGGDGPVASLARPRGKVTGPARAAGGGGV